MHVSILPKFKKASWLILWVLTAIMSVPEMNAQRLALKTNALDYLVMLPNLTLEARLSRRISLQLGVAANPFQFTVANAKLTNFRVEPEIRYWFNRPMARHFIALSATAATYSLGYKERVFKGDAVMAGVSYGYAVVLGNHWNMEAEVGVGLGSFKAYNYKRPAKEPASQNYSKILPVPVRLGLTFAYIFK